MYFALLVYSYTDVFMVQIGAIRVGRFCIFHTNEINSENLKLDKTGSCVKLAKKCGHTR